MKFTAASTHLKEIYFRIIHFNIGNTGSRKDDGRVFFEDNLGTAIREKRLPIPPPKPLPKDRNVWHYTVF